MGVPKTEQQKVNQMKRILYILTLFMSIVACTEEIDKSNRYTFTGETIADFLRNRSDKYSHMITLLERAGLFGLLSTYGQYTLFLPNNAAIERFVAEQDSIYHATIETGRPIYTGVTSPLVEELSDSMANVIARMHLIERNYRTAEFGEGAIGKWNFSDRALSINYKVVDERFYIMLNNCAAIIDGDNDVENGIIHIIDKPINPEYKTISSQISEHRFFSIFNSAIAETGFADAVSGNLMNDSEALKDELQNEYGLNRTRYKKFTAFIEPDEVFNENGIYTLDDLKAFAEKWYGTEEKGNYKSPKNALYKFVAYHFVRGEIPYNRVVVSRSGTTTSLFDDYYIPGYDLYNYYVTLQNTIVKALKPLSTADGLNIYLNYSKRKNPYNHEMRKHVNVRVIELTEFTNMDEQYANFVPNAGNGIIHPIDKILIYNEDEMVGNVLDERMRFDLASLQPELSSNNIWHNNSAFLPADYFEGVRKEGGNGFFIYTQGGGYMCDIMYLYVDFDFSFKLPPVPPRTYEIRISVSAHNMVNTGRTMAKYQLYFDGKICGNPMLMEPMAVDPEIGWEDDNQTFDNGLENDKQMRNRGWMKAPDSYNNYTPTGYQDGRKNYMRLRKIIDRKYLDNGEHWLRFRYLGMPYNEGYKLYVLNVDYIEIVPLHIVSDPVNPEDRH